jgi:integrase
MTDHTHTEQKTDGNSNWRFNARCRKGGFFVSDRRNRTSITVKLQPEEFSKLLETMRTENPDTPKPRRVHLVSQAIEILERAGKVRGISHRYVCTYKGMPVRSIKRALSTALRKTCISDFRFHDLRHTFNTNMQRAGVRDTVTMQHTGHKTLSMFVRYSSVDFDDGKEAAARFSAFLETESRKDYCNSTAEGTKGLGENA